MTMTSVMHNLRSFFLVLTLTVMYHFGFAQELPTPFNVPIPPGPEAAALGQYGNVPVSYFTGRVNVSIPIWEFSGKETNFNVSLSHSGGARKVEEIATWVGLGWSLNAGGVITRTVNGAADDYQDPDPDHRNYFQSGQRTKQFFDRELNLQEEYFFQDSVLNQYYDPQPDYYYFNFGGYSGRLFIDPSDFQVYTDEMQGLKIEFNDLTQVSLTTGRIYDWKITTPDGTQYFFGLKTGENTSENDLKNADALEYTEYFPDDAVPGSNQVTKHISSWYLYRIVSANEIDEVLIDYAKYASQVVENDPVGSASASTTYSGDPVVWNPTLETGGQSIQNNRYPSLVTFVGLGTASFDISPLAREDLTGRPVLESITISDDLGNDIRRFDLYTSYMNPLSSVPEEKRLMLDSVQEVGLDASGSASITKPPYKMDYGTVDLPSRHSLEQDYWGFFNENGSNDPLANFAPLIKAEGDPFDATGVSKKGKLSAAIAGALHGITYPTGGSTEFTYGLNRAIDVDESNNHWTEINHPTVSVIGGINSNTVADLCFAYEQSGSGCYCEERGMPYTLVEEITLEPTFSQVTYPKFRITFSNSQTSRPADENEYSYAAIIEKNAPSYYDGCMITENPSPYYKRWYTGDNPETIDLDLLGGLQQGKTYLLVVASNVPNHSVAIDYTYYRYTNDPPVVEKPAGDIRVESIQDITDEGAVVTRTLLYGQGHLYAEPKKYDWKDVENNCPGATSADIYYRYSSNLSSLGSVQGSIVGYGKVTESISGNGKKVYQYNTNGNYTRNGFPHTPSSVVASLAGKLQQETTYSESGQKLKLVTNSYESKDEPSVSGIKVAASTQVEMVVGYHDGNVQTVNNVDPSKVPSFVPPTYSAVAGWHAVEKCREEEYFCIEWTYDEALSEGYVGLPWYDADDEWIVYRLCTQLSLGIEDFGSKFTYGQYSLNAKFPYLAQTIDSTFSQEISGGVKVTTTDYLYNDSINYQLRYKTTYTNDAPDTTRMVYKYAVDYDVSGLEYDNYIQPLLLKSMTGIPIEQQYFVNQDLISAQITDFKGLDNGFVRPSASYLLQSDLPIANAEDGSDYYSQVFYDSYFDWKQEVRYYDHGQPKQLTTRDGVTKGFKWDDSGYYLTAQIINATPDEVHYTSFEEDPLATSDSPYTGGYSRAITGSLVLNIVDENDNILTFTGDYILTYWKQVNPGDPWEEVVIPYPAFSGTSITINETATIDEVRFYPTNAQLTTFTHLPLIGVTSICDAKNKVSRFEYDDLGRLIQAKDHHGNVLQEYEYYYKNGEE